MLENTWDFRGIKYGPDADRKRQALILGWSLDFDSISQDYPDDTPAREIFRAWLGRLPEDAENVAVNWWIPTMGESLPFLGEDEDFLTFYSWPTHSDTGEKLNWLKLPVEDKVWNAERTDPGGFVQEVTGWKPSAFQRTVHLPTLLRASGWSR